MEKPKTSSYHKRFDSFVSERLHPKTTSNLFKDYQVGGEGFKKQHTAKREMVQTGG